MSAIALPRRTGPRHGERPGPRIAARTSAGWPQVDYTRFSIRPLNTTIGAEVEGISLAEPLGDEAHAQLHAALLEWKVLFFRGQHLTGPQHEAIGASWGELETNPILAALGSRVDDLAKVVRFEKGENVGGQENLWHSDVSWRVSPSLGSILRAVEVPAAGGDTLFADMGAAYDCLEDELKAAIDGRSAVHDWWSAFSGVMSREDRDALRPNLPSVEHPIVRTHPETGRKTLYVNAAFTEHIVGLDPDVSETLLDILFRQASYPEYQCRWKWTAGDVAFWDNRATQHYASSDYHPQRRVMERVTIAGDRPY